MTSQHGSGDSAEVDWENGNFRGLELTVVPTDVFSMENVRRLDLSLNKITRFPGARVSQELPNLEVLLLTDNLLHVLEDILALASAPRLCELDVRDNPLRLSHNRLYLLEALLFHEANIDEDILRELHRDEDLKNFSCKSQFPRKMLYRQRLPRRRAFPMLQMLNGDWICDLESRQVELEQGKSLEYFRSQIQRNQKGTVKAKQNKTNGINLNERRNDARITAIPLPQALKHYQIDIESCEEISDIKNELTTNLTPSHTEVSEVSSDEEDEHELMERLYRPLTWQSKSEDLAEQTEEMDSVSKRQNGSSESEPWNYPISTFDDLHSDERQYVRYKSKHAGGTLERDDHFFESTTFIDCVAQCERSRRLTIRAVDLLTQPHAATEITSELFSSRVIGSTQSAPQLPISEAAAALKDNLTSNFTKQHAQQSFQVKDPPHEVTSVAHY
ncbi:unnamed protein product [Phytophthora fragariaefolia]|uniref:Unnamed protein product n=1 Tax=Phytophthora fragariaefolia TaxID=1490495 RepID=A0A9W6XFS9_9STRA|nr:unnamed protein product [Phytophthora fragariaefolia]